eukprot:g60054.t1
MAAVFYRASNFNQVLDSWNVSMVTYMASMFFEAFQFNQALASLDVSKVTNMQFMFYSARLFNQALASWDVSMVAIMQLMFYNASQLRQNLTSWNTSQVSNCNEFASLSNMCAGLLPISKQPANLRLQRCGSEPWLLLLDQSRGSGASTIRRRKLDCQDKRYGIIQCLKFLGVFIYWKTEPFEPPNAVEGPLSILEDMCCTTYPMIRTLRAMT